MEKHMPVKQLEIVKSDRMSITISMRTLNLQNILLEILNTSLDGMYLQSAWKNLQKKNSASILCKINCRHPLTNN